MTFRSLTLLIMHIFEYDITRIQPQLGETFIWQNLTLWPRELPGLDQVTNLSGPSHLSCKREIIWTGQVPHRVTSPNWGPPP